MEINNNNNNNCNLYNKTVHNSNNKNIHKFSKEFNPKCKAFVKISNINKSSNKMMNNKSLKNKGSLKRGNQINPMKMNHYYEPIIYKYLIL